MPDAGKPPNKLQLLAEIFNEVLPVQSIEVDEDLNCIIIELDDEKFLQQLIEINRKNRNFQ
ncbi:MAG: hypothetical protein QW304_08870 [Thermoproteota archaeon]